MLYSMLAINIYFYYIYYIYIFSPELQMKTYHSLVINIIEIFPNIFLRRLTLHIKTSTIRSHQILGDFAINKLIEAIHLLP